MTAELPESAKGLRAAVDPPIECSHEDEYHWPIRGLVVAHSPDREGILS